MKRCFWIVGIALAALGSAQALPKAPGAFKIPVYHADPWFVVSMLQGQLVPSPELSTLLGFMGAPPQAAEGLNRIFKGRFTVNPTDNSIWFFPDPGT
jgi:hypothetical protein